jgi:hypothetical protein
VARPWRFLLDQNFPSPVIDVHAVDKTVKYEALKTFDPALARRNTPDWVIYLRAADSGRFDGVVTRDKSQLDQPEELVALLDTGLTVVTWRHPVEDPIQEWGQLLAYMPLVTKHMEQLLKQSRGRRSAHAFFLPRPRLTKDNASAVRDLLGQVATAERRSFPEVRDRARREMRSELRDRKLDELGNLLGVMAQVARPDDGNDETQSEA